MKCRVVRKEIEEIDAGKAFSVETDAHLPVCESCREFADERMALRALVGGLDRVSAPPDFDWRLRARLMEARSESAPSRRLLASFAPGTQAMAVAATFVFLIAGVIVYRQLKPLLASKTEPAPIAATSEKAAADTNDASSQNLSRQDSTAVASSASKPSMELKATQRARSNVKSSRANLAKAETARSTPVRERILSTDFGSRPAEELSATNSKNAFTSAGPVFPVPVRSNKSTRLQFEDGEGTKRSLAPLIFGGQESIERKDGMRLVSTGNRGVW